MQTFFIPYSKLQTNVVKATIRGFLNSDRAKNPRGVSLSFLRLSIFGKIYPRFTMSLGLSCKVGREICNILFKSYQL